MRSNVVALPHALALADLARSGLDSKDLKKLKAEVLSSDGTFEITQKYKARSIKLPYLDQRGRDTGFFRLRFLDDVRGFGAKKPLRYWQPPDSEPRAYLAPYIDWPKLLADPSQELWFTEGEKKAAAACKAGINCIGLGGVWNWRSTRSRQPLIADLALIAFKGRRVVLCFDTDVDPNPLVVGALETFGHTLEQRGTQVGVVTLPLAPDEEKCGLDDFLVKNSVKALKALEITTLASGAELVKLNDELVSIEQPSSLLWLKTRVLFKSSRQLIDLHFAHRRVSGVDSAGRLVELNAVAEWLRWPNHRVAPGVVFEPGEKKVLEDGCVNLWPGWAAQPKKGDVSLFIRLIDYLFSAVPAEQKRWFLQWLAYPVQNPGAKLYAACVLWGRDTGTGKSLVGYTIGRLYGPGFAVVTEHQLHGSFNGWQAHRQFILGEEITGSDRRAEANRLKHVISGEVATVNEKFQAEYTVRNCANFLFTSNHHDAFIVEDKDRRFFIHEVGEATQGQRPSERWFTQEYDGWYKTDEAVGALMHYLLHHVDCSGFDPRERAPVTQAKEEMIRASGAEADFMVREFLERPEMMLKIGETRLERDLFTLEELWALLGCRERQISPLQLARAFRRAGLPEAKMVRLGERRERLWAVRNLKRWKRATHQEFAKHYEPMIETAKKPRF